MLAEIRSQYDFDPTYGYTYEDLLQVPYPEIPSDYVPFWQGLYQSALDIKPKAKIKDRGISSNGFRVFDVYYRSTNFARIGGWLLLPEKSSPKRGFIVGHGYGGRDAPDLHLPFKDAAILFPCFRGLGRSLNHPISRDSWYHVLHDIDKPRRYVHGGCAQDIWCGVTVLLRMFPELEDHLGYLGISFGGGIGAMAVAMEKRFKKAHFNVPSFGNHSLRMKLPNLGSGASVQNFYKKNPKRCMETLRLYDSAVSAQLINIPTHFACALYDPMVPPPGQFAVHNAKTRGHKELFVLSAAHHDYPEAERENDELLQELDRFFSIL
jgi:cephalosporin-C deacetylase